MVTLSVNLDTAVLVYGFGNSPLTNCVDENCLVLLNIENGLKDAIQSTLLSLRQGPRFASTSADDQNTKRFRDDVAEGRVRVKKVVRCLGTTPRSMRPYHYDNNQSD